MNKPLLICLLGPTAAGKTRLAIELAEARHCELISVDSAQVYRGLDIGSARSHYPHRLVAIRDPLQPYSVAEFCTDARAAMAEIQAAGKTPLLVGGTMMYFKALLRGLADMPVADPALRQQLQREAEKKGWPALHRRLREVDPDSAARIHPRHSQRIGRALEVYLSTGVSSTDWHRRQARRGGISESWQVVQIALAPAARAVLHQRIEQRVAEMFERGLVDEVRGLCQRGDLSPGLPAMRAVGYRQVWAHVQGEYDRDTARQRCIEASRQLAKRQLTWLRKWPGLNWIFTDGAGLAGSSPEKLDKLPTTPLRLALKYLPPENNRPARLLPV